MSRLKREADTIEAMVRLYCLQHHQPKGSHEDLCVNCEQLLDYARERLARCPFGETKPACSKCHVHCYKPQMREQVKKVMRWAGPRMLFYHPVMTFWHFWDKFGAGEEKTKND